jgi:putative transposase
MNLAHKVQRNPTPEQEVSFRQAAGCARFVWNWALAQWLEGNSQTNAPSPNELKKQFNAIKYDRFPWMKDVHRDAHSQPFANLRKTVNRYFKALKNHEEPHKPQFKKKGKAHDTFYLANDRFQLDFHAAGAAWKSNQSKNPRFHKSEKSIRVRTRTNQYDGNHTRHKRRDHS